MSSEERRRQGLLVLVIPNSDKSIYVDSLCELGNEPTVLTHARGLKNRLKNELVEINFDRETIVPP